MSRDLPDFTFEKKYWKEGYPLVFGVDEVGRGALAGPVVAGAVALRIQYSEFRIQKKIMRLGIDDSKRLTPKRREELSFIIPKYFQTGIGEASVGEINDVGIVKATQQAMRRAIVQCSNAPMFQFSKNIQFIIVDGNKTICGISQKRQKAIVDGDQKSVSIAAASIMAKVYRDRLMSLLSGKYKGYGWDHNAGYGTAYHFEALIIHGVTTLHRHFFVDFPKVS